MLKTILKFLCISSCLFLMLFCTKEPEMTFGSDFDFNCNSPITICSMPDSIGREFAAMDCDGGGVSNLLECINGTDFKDGEDDCAAAIRGKIDICMLMLNDPDDPNSGFDQSHVLAQLDCDGGGITNYEECVNGFDPIKSNDFDELNDRDNNLEIEKYLRSINFITLSDMILDSIGVIAVLPDSVEVFKSESGLVFAIEEMGSGEIPMAEDSISYKFESSYLENCNPVTIANLTTDTSEVDNLIAGLQEALGYFPVGSKGKLIIPSRIAYNNLIFEGIPSYSVIVMDIELLSIL